MLLPAGVKLPGPEVAGKEAPPKRPLQTYRTDATRLVRFKGKQEETGGNDVGKPGAEVAGKHPLNGPAKRVEIPRLLRPGRY